MQIGRYIIAIAQTKTTSGNFYPQTNVVGDYMRYRQILMVFGIFSMLGNSILLYYTFLRAYFHNGVTIICIDKYNEAHIEFILLPMCLVVSICATIVVVRAYLQR